VFPYLKLINVVIEKIYKLTNVVDIHYYLLIWMIHNHRMMIEEDEDKVKKAMSLLRHVQKIEELLKEWKRIYEVDL
jgi:hypothetical protein